MRFEQDYMILNPFQLPWMYVSPLDDKGLEYHLSPDLSIHLEGIVTGDMDFIISHIIFGIEGIEVNELQAEEMFMSEYLPAKSKERVGRAFKTGHSSCFFTSKQMEYLQKLFDEKNFMCHNVSVVYKDRKVDDIVALPPKEFKLISDAFSDLDVVLKLDYKKSKEEMEEKYEEFYKAKIASLEDRRRKSFWDKIKGKGIKKQIAASFGTLLAGIVGMGLRRFFWSKGGLGFGILAVLSTFLGIILEMFGRSEVARTISILRSENTERVVFG